LLALAAFALFSALFEACRGAKGRSAQPENSTTLEQTDTARNDLRIADIYFSKCGGVALCSLAPRRRFEVTARASPCRHGVVTRRK
jgi:hypothetical protein